MVDLDKVPVAGEPTTSEQAAVRAPNPGSAPEVGPEAGAPGAPTEPEPDPPPEVDPDRRIGLLAIAVGVVPVLVAGVRAALRGWTPTGDDAYSAVRAWDVFSPHVPLLGTWSSASLYTGHQINHPGPLQFDLLAVPVRLLGHGAGTAVGMALVNAAAVGLIGWLVLRRHGGAAAALAMGLVALLTWSMGSQMLFDPWSQHGPLLPFALFMVAAWCVAAGDFVALPIMVVAGADALQTHLSYTLLVPGLAVAAIVAAAAGCLWQRRHAPADWAQARAGTLRWLAIGAVTWLVAFAQPLCEQLTADGEGNLVALVHSRDKGDVPTPTLDGSIRALGGTVAVPPAWLPPSYGSPSFRLDGGGRPTWLAAAGLLALAALLVVLGARAWRRGRRAVAAGTAMALVALAIGLITVDSAPARWGMAPTYLRWMWPLGMVVWLTIAVALLDEVQTHRNRTPCNLAHRNQAHRNQAHRDQARRQHDRGERNEGTVPRRSSRAAMAGLALTVVAAAATLPTVDHGSGSPPWTVDAIRQVDDDVAAAVRDEPGVLVEMGGHIAVGTTGPALFGVLQDAGVPFFVDEVPLIRQLGTGRAYHDGDATVRLAVRAGRADSARPGERLIAASHPLSDAEEREHARLTARVRDLVAEHGLPLTDDADDVFIGLRQPEMLDRVADVAGDPGRALRSGLVRQLWTGSATDLAGGPLLDPEVFPADLFDRWASLDGRRDDQVLHVYLSPLLDRS